jgi:hypothetical protein
VLLKAVQGRRSAKDPLRGSIKGPSQNTIVLPF